MIFITVGSQKFQFDRLIKAVDGLISSGVIEDNAFAQTGACVYVPTHMSHEAFLDRDSFRKRMVSCDVVVTHGGTGAIISAVKSGKKVIAVPRLAKYGEHVDNHQVEIVKQFGEMGLIEPCIDIADLASAYERAVIKNYRTYKSNTAFFCAELSEYIDEIGGLR